MTQNRADGTMTQQMRIRYFVMNLVYHNTGKSVKVPSTRELAKRFGIARSTIQLAFEQLIKEGYLVCRQGAATMTNPLSHFVLQPETRNPLIGVKLYEGDAFYYGANFWRSISSVATELTERGFNIRLLMNAAITPESIDRWCHAATCSRIEPMKDIAKMLTTHRPLILNYFRAKKQFNSGIVEGLNRKINLTIRKSFGFRTLKIAKICLYHQLGELPEPEFAHKFW